MLKDLNVIELASVLAGPSVGTFLAELGAEVTKVENSTTGGDITRSWKLPQEVKKIKTSAYFASANYGKTHLFKDLNNPEDREFTHNLIKDCDIVIGNFKPGSAIKLGFDYETLSSQNPRLIYVNLIGFEESDKPAYDIVLQAETGWLSMTGTENSPAKTPVAMIDLIAAHHMKEAILLALLKKEKTGKGSFVELSLEKASLASLANQASNYLNEKYIAKPIGTLHPNIAPYGEIIQTSDDIGVVLAIGSDIQFANLCEVLGLNNLAIELKFSRNSQRVENRKELILLIRPKAKLMTYKLFETKCNQLKIPFGKIKNIDEVMNSKAAREMLLTDNDGLQRLSQLAFDKNDVNF